MRVEIGRETLRKEETFNIALLTNRFERTPPGLKDNASESEVII